MHLLVDSADYKNNFTEFRFFKFNYCKIRDFCVSLQLGDSDIEKITDGDFSLHLNHHIMRIKYLLLFYGRTLKISIFIVIIVFVIARQSMMIEDALVIGLLYFPTFGLGIDALFRLLFRKKDFYFYHNGSWSIGGLYFSSFILSTIISLIFHFIFKLTMPWY